MAEARSKEALVVCSDRNMNAGITIWDLETGEDLCHIPTCASPLHGLVCLKNQFLLASQVQRHRSFGGGAIFTWSLNKPQVLHRSYPLECIGPICSTKDGLFLVGGAPSGNAYIWEISSGKLLKIWRAHGKSLSCFSISGDDSLLISGADDGVVCVWTMISVLDISDSEQCVNLPSFYTWSQHEAPITALLSTSIGLNSFMISSSVDGVCKVWDLTSGRLLQTHSYICGVTAIALDPDEQVLFSGCDDGSIFINQLDIGFEDNPPIILGDHSMVLSGHKGSITALSFSINGSWLISASEDCTVCIWDVRNWQIIRKFDHKKGRITNLVVVPQISLLAEYARRSLPRLHVSVLDKAPNHKDKSDVVSTLHTRRIPEDHIQSSGFRSYTSMVQQILDLEQGRTSEAIQMKVETSVENRLWAMSMTKHMSAMNNHLRSRFLDLMQYQLPAHPDLTIEKRKKQKSSDKEDLRETPA
ncbi:hypothetical protein H6P81_013289 [Aristolochia fimbriata]|uniref:Protein ROOT INITIATION DEFECTIVE 3-like n=1 Tax=Aristolochia fimbriata TaxID=158543 RepID=A0AAV7EH61_ARIFI|nr:hypothetical protein H6P81_013289 [Aristolochia fimbriata]